MALSLNKQRAVRGIAGLLALFVIITLLNTTGVQALPLRQDSAAFISSPSDGSTVSGSVQISGSALHPAFQRYELYFTAEPGENWVFIGDIHTNQVNNGFLGSWETGSLPDGSYSLRLRVVRLDGNYDDGFARNLVVANSAPVATDTPIPEPTPDPLVASPVVNVEATLPPSIEGVVTPTPAATATPVTVEQPDIPTPTPRPSDTGESGNTQAVAAADSDKDNTSGGAALADVLETSTLRSSFMRGAGMAGAAFLAVGVFFAVRRLLAWLWYRFMP